MFDYYKKRFEKWEAKKRTKLGDKAFLQKYIRSFTKSNKMMRWLLPLLLVLWPLNLIIHSANYVRASGDDKIFYLILLVCFAFTLVMCIILAVTYYAHHFNFLKQKIEDWTKELAQMDNPKQINADITSFNNDNQ